ncbi:MAG: ankyrin repeat domain-containing protein [Armatimonadetes bacterium]|nr:ankyrin repeat domain-containing protein [Armatimonadota bacterium]
MALGDLTPLTRAALEGDSAGIAVLLQEGADPEGEALLPREGAAPDHPALARWAPAYSPQTPLSLAAARGHVAVVRELIRGGARIERRDAEGFTALMLAAWQGHAGVVEALLQAGADPSARFPLGGNSVWLAACEGHAEAVRLLLEAGAAPDEGGPLGSTALEAAAREGSLEVIRLLLAAGADPNEPAFGGTPVEVAVSRGQAAVVQALLEGGAGADPTLLHAWAASTASTEVLGLLLERRLELDVPDSLGRTALWLCARNGKRAGVELLLGAGADPEGGEPGPLSIAARAGELEMVSQLARAGARLDRARRDGSTPLMEAAENRWSEVASRLLTLGADPKAADAAGRTARIRALEAGAREAADLLPPQEGESLARLIGAVRTDDLERARELLEGGVSPRGLTVSDRERGRRSLLVLACQREQQDMALLLLAHGADPEAVIECETPPWEVTPLMVAAALGLVRAIDALIRAGVDLEARDSGFEEGGRTALMVAAEHDQPGVLEQLLRAGADACVRCQEQSTALMAACASGSLECARMLVEAGCPVDAADESGQTALIHACHCRHPELVSYLLEHGADPNAAPQIGPDALTAAAASGSSAVVARLLQASAGAGSEAVCQALRRGHGEVAEQLLDRVPAESAGPVLVEACALGQRALARRLLGARVSPEATDEAGRTSLMLACDRGDLEMVELLLAAGADPAAREPDTGESALHCAVRRGNPGIVKTLLAAGADPDLPDTWEGSTPLALAASQGDLPLVELLLEAGADPERADHNGETPLDSARRRGRAGVCRRLETSPGADVSDRG